MDPMMAQLAMMLSQNPEMGQHLDALGIPPPGQQGSPMGLGGPPSNIAAFMDPANAGQAQPATTGQPMAIPGQGQTAAAGINVAPPNETPAAGGVSPSILPGQAQAVPGAATPTPATAGQAATDPKSQAMQQLLLAGMQGVKAPAPIQPIMNGGVTGGVKTPTDFAAMNKQQIGSPLTQALISALLNRPQHPQEPTLHSLLR